MILIMYVKCFFKIIVPFCCVTHRSHAIYTAVSRYGVISFFETPLNLTISFDYIFSRGFKQRISSELDGYFPIVQFICSRHVLFMETMMLAKLEISSAHNFGV